jgi:hypothetical protein
MINLENSYFFLLFSFFNLKISLDDNRCENKLNPKAVSAAKTPSKHKKNKIPSKTPCKIEKYISK